MDKVERLDAMVKEVNSWDGSLEEFEMYENDEYFFDMFYGDRVNELVRALSFGDYNYNHEFVKVDVYGNIESFSQPDYEDMLRESEDEIIERYNELLEDGSIDEID